MNKLLASKAKGIIPVYKDAGINCLTILRWVKLHIAYDYGFKNTYKPRVESFRILEPYASGVYTIGIGGPSLYIKYMQFCDSRFTLDLKMGQSTLNDYYTDNVVETKPFSHVNLELVKQACSSFIGSTTQAMPIIIFKDPNYMEDVFGYSSDDENLDSSESNYWGGIDQMPVKRRKALHHRKVTCHSIEVTKFDPPNISFEIFCGNTFIIRSFIKDLCEKLGTCGSIVKLERTQEGPFTIDHCIKKTDLYLDYLIPVLKTHSTTYIDAVRQHLDKIPFYGNKRMPKSPLEVM